jgi:hypothetical protein
MPPPPLFRRKEPAARMLDPVGPHEALTLGPAYLRGEAYLALGKLDLALEEFQKFALHESVEPLSGEYPLELLEMARIYKK